MKSPYLSLLFLLLALNSLAQPKIHVSGLNTSVSDQLDSVFIKSLENEFTFELPKELYQVQGFKYRMQGYDENWINSDFPTARYINLPGGDYIFEYQVENQKINTVVVIVSFAIWQKWWFWPMIAAYFIFLIGIGLFFFFQYNYRQKLKLNHIRNKISSDLHDEVGSNLSSIAIYTEVLKKKLGKEAPEIALLLDKITGNSKESVNLMQDTVWALNPTNDTSEKLVQRIIGFGKGILAAKGVAFSHNVSVELSKLKLDMEERKNCYMIMKEAINNIAKHSEASNAEFSVYESEKDITFELSDNGKGFDISNQTDGNGLRNYKERADDSEFKIHISSKINIGTSIKLIVT